MKLRSRRASSPARRCRSRSLRRSSSRSWAADHVLLLHRKTLCLGDLQQVFKVERLLQPRRQLGLLACVGEEGVELFERQGTI